MNKALLALLITLSLIAVFLLLKNIERKTLDTSPVNNEQLPKDWSIYKSPTLPFSIGLPPQWKTQIQTPTLVEFSSLKNPDNTLGFIEINFGSLEEVTQRWVDELKPKSILNWEDTDFAGKETQKINMLLSNGPDEYWFVKNSEDIYIFNLTDENGETFHQMLATFKFLDFTPINLQNCDAFEGAEFCTQQFEPVCARIHTNETGLISWKSFGNACTACISSTEIETVVGYFANTCENL